jgi:hypothetical protein
MKERKMATALNMTMPLKQDPESQAKLASLAEHFASGPQKLVDAALAKSEIVHYARFLVIDNKYIQVLTEFDGEKEEYTEFFRKELTEVFRLVFSLVEGVPPWEEINDPDTFFKVARSFNLRGLGDSVENDPQQGYLFCAYGNTTVREIKQGLSANTTVATAVVNTTTPVANPPLVTP